MPYYVPRAMVGALGANDGDCGVGEVGDGDEWVGDGGDIEIDVSETCCDTGEDAENGKTELNYFLHFNSNRIEILQNLKIL